MSFFNTVYIGRHIPTFRGNVLSHFQDQIHFNPESEYSIFLRNTYLYARLHGVPAPEDILNILHLPNVASYTANSVCFKTSI